MLWLILACAYSTLAVINFLTYLEIRKIGGVYIGRGLIVVGGRPPRRHVVNLGKYFRWSAITNFISFFLAALASILTYVTLAL